MLVITKLNDPMNIRATINGLPIYLDNHSYIQLAGRDEARATQVLYDFAGPCIHVLESCPISNFIDGSDSFR